ncbi:hypothetical protein QR66_08440 [Chromobacterium piscinae]|nr:hypothetical protein QR66_08440 [Chromobacterium piscinae]
MWRWGIAAAWCVNSVWAGSCWEQAEQETGISRYLLYAVAKVESSHQPLAMAVAKKGVWLGRQPRNLEEALRWANWFERNGYVFAVGMTQINWPAHRKSLQARGITLRQLLSDPCLQIREGARILDAGFQMEGANWSGVGAYYTGPKRKLPWERYHYARKVHHWYVRYVNQPPALVVPALPG